MISYVHPAFDSNGKAAKICSMVRGIIPRLAALATSADGSGTSNTWRMMCVRWWWGRVLRVTVRHMYAVKVVG